MELQPRNSERLEKARSMRSPPGPSEGAVGWIPWFSPLEARVGLQTQAALR